MEQKVWFITGASKGFGLEIAKAALANGDKIVATVRKNPEAFVAKFQEKDSVLIVQLDVTNEQQVKIGVEKAINRFGRIDVLVNNAGYGLLAATEEASDEEVKKQYDTNVFGLLNVTRAVLPHMRSQRSGHIINISSLFGYLASVPGLGIYGSTKFAVEGISEGRRKSTGDRCRYTGTWFGHNSRWLTAERVFQAGQALGGSVTTGGHRWVMQSQPLVSDSWSKS
jgi:NADP-dependent 3-hydroxy acid dehydrogenase YdfG